MSEEDEATRPPLPVPDKSGPPTINLAVLLDFAVQQIFHEITVLSELLPKKRDSDRKISLVQFAQSTRLLFVKLLAIVKWLKSSKKFQTCTSICYLLDQQASYFVDTADRLVSLAREELLYARLPSFQVAAAIDVLTLGTFSRLPACIKSNFVREPKITPREQAVALMRINQVLNFRLSRIVQTLSPRINKIVVKNGMVRFTVDGEFEATLTVLGELPSLKWTLLNIKMLVQDYEIGEGLELVHPNQLHGLHVCVQSRMDASKTPIPEMYQVMHSFAQMLQLDVLHCQALKLMQRLNGIISVQKYDPQARVLVIGYWMAQSGKRMMGHPPKMTPSYSLAIFGDLADPDVGLRVKHYPVGPEYTAFDVRSGRLSLIGILSEAFSFRCRERLLRIKKRIETSQPNTQVSLSGFITPSLCVRVFSDVAVSAPFATDDENLIVSINMFTGSILCSIASLPPHNAELKDLETVLYNSVVSSDALKKIFYRIKVSLLIERYRKAVAVLQVRIINEQQMKPLLEKVPQVPADRICLQFIKEDVCYLIIGFVPDEDITVRTKIYLLESQPILEIRDITNDDNYMSPEMRRLTQAEEELEEQMDEEGRRITFRPESRPVVRTWDRQLAHAVSTIEDRVAFNRVCMALQKKNIRFEWPRIEEKVGGMILNITDVSEALDVQCTAFFSALVRCCLRLDTRGRVLYPFECCLVNTPVVADFLPSQRRIAGARLVSSHILDLNAPSVPSSSECVSTSIVDRLTTYCHMYDIVARFAPLYERYYHEHCSIQHFTYHKLVLAYGPLRDQLLIVSYRIKGSSRLLMLNFGQCAPQSAHSQQQLRTIECRTNPHTLMSHILTERLNHNWNFGEFVHCLITTLTPLTYLANFWRFRFESLRVWAQMMSVDIQFTLQFRCSLIAINETTVHLVYSHIHLEFSILEESKVSVRDVTGKAPAAAGLYHFFSLLSNGGAQLYGPPSVSGPSLAAAESPAQPASYPSQLRDDRSESARLSRSVPPPANASADSPHPSASVSAEGAPASTLACSYRRILIDNDTLHRATMFPEGGSGFIMRQSALDDYLHALVFIKRLGSSFEGYRQHTTNNPSAPSYISFNELTCTIDSVFVSVNSASPQQTPKPYSTVHFNFHLDPATMKLKVKIQYIGEHTPSDMDVAIAERYFEEIVSRMKNELAVVSFITLCRVTLNNAFNNIAQIMHCQMEPPPHAYWTVSFLLTLLGKGEGGTAGKKHACGIILEPTNTACSLTLVFRPMRKSERMAEKHQLRMVYYLNNNQLKLPHTQAQAAQQNDEDINALLAMCSDSAARTGECPLYPAVRQLIDRFSNVSAMPSSVGMPGSTNPGSIINPGSNASQRQ